MADPRAQALLLVHSTTGRPLTIRYDARTNAMAFEEADWHAEGFRLGHEARPATRPALPRQRISVRRAR